MCIRDRIFIGFGNVTVKYTVVLLVGLAWLIFLLIVIPGLLIVTELSVDVEARFVSPFKSVIPCLLYTSDAADERSSVDLGGRRIIKKKREKKKKKKRRYKKKKVTNHKRK